MRYHPHPGPQPAVSSSIWFVRPFPSKVSKTRVLQGLSSDIPGYFLSPVTKFQVKYSSLPFGKVGLFTTPSHVSSPHLFQQQAATRFSILALNWVRFCSSLLSLQLLSPHQVSYAFRWRVSSSAFAFGGFQQGLDHSGDPRSLSLFALLLLCEFYSASYCYSASLLFTVALRVYCALRVCCS